MLVRVPDTYPVIAAAVVALLLFCCCGISRVFALKLTCRRVKVSSLALSAFGRQNAIASSLVMSPYSTLILAQTTHKQSRANKIQAMHRCKAAPASPLTSTHHTRHQTRQNQGEEGERVERGSSEDRPTKEKKRCNNKCGAINMRHNQKRNRHIFTVLRAIRAP